MLTHEAQRLPFDRKSLSPRLRVSAVKIMAQPIITPIHKGRIFDVCLEQITLPNGASITLEIVRHPGAAAIVAVDANDEVTLVNQFRHAAGGFIWELPAGTLNPGEAPDACARRELREEAGLDARDWTPLGSILTTPGFCNERIHLFLARGLSQGDQQLDHDEILSVRRFPFAQALQMIRDGEIQDAKSIAGLHLAAGALGGR
jgi:ADP-ribose pyrophosphatase